MKYQDYEFTKDDLAYYHSLHDNNHPYNIITRLEKLFDLYRPKIKKTTIQLAQYLDKKNINLYEESMKYFTSYYYNHKHPNVFELFVTGIELGKIDVINNVEQYKLLTEIFNIKMYSTSKTLFENKLVILKELIKKDSKYIELLPEFLITYDSEHNFDVAMKKKLESYISTLPINLENYPQLTQLYQSLHKENYLEIEHHEIYKIKIDSNAIASQYKRATKNIQNQLVDSLGYIHSLLFTKEVLNENGNFQFVRFTRQSELTTKIEAEFVVADEISYQILENNLNFVIPEIIGAIINKKPYDKDGIKQLMKNLYLYDKLQNNVPAKENVQSKLKI